MIEISILGSDVQEIVGSAIAFRLLFGFPLFLGCLLTFADTFTFLGLRATGVQKLEALFGVLIATLVLCFLVDFIITKPSPMGILQGMIFPSVSEARAIQAASLLGAVVMPQSLYLHSALVLSRRIDRTSPDQVREANRYFAIEAKGALFLTFLINSAIVSVFAQSFYSETCDARNVKSLMLSTHQKASPPFACVPHDPFSNMPEDLVTSHLSCNLGAAAGSAVSHGTCRPIGLEDAGRPLELLLGREATILWAIGLLIAGQLSTVTGTFAGQYVMEGMLNLNLPNWQRVALTRGVALVPATAVALMASHDFVAADRLDEMLNVVQSIQLPFALIPLLLVCADEKLLGKEFVMSRFDKFVGWGLTLTILCVNFFLVGDKLQSMIKSPFQICVGLICVGLYVSFLLRLVRSYKPSDQEVEVMDSGGGGVSSVTGEEKKLMSRGDVEKRGEAVSINGNYSTM